MKTFFKSKMKKALSLCLALSLILCVFAGAAVPASAESIDTSVFSAYYSANLQDSEKLSPVSLEPQWIVGDTNVTRNLTINGNFDSNDWGGGMVRFMSTLYYNVKEYNGFDMTVDFHTHEDANNHIAFVGFGAKKGTSWLYNDGDYPFVLRADGNVVNAKTGAFVTSGGKSALDQTAADGKAWSYVSHTLRVKVGAGSYTMWIDGYEVANGALENYNGGYIYFAANAGSVWFGAPTVKEIVDTSLFDAYFSEDLSANAELTKAELSDSWEINAEGNRVYRKSNPYGNGGAHDWGGLNKYASVLYYNVNSYNNFIMEVDYKVAADNCHYALVGFGGEKGKSWKHSDSDVTLAINAGGSLYNVANDDWLAGGDGTAAAQTVAAGGTWDNLGVHTLKIKMVNGTYSAWIDGYKLADRTVSGYNGGYIYFAATALGAEFSVPKVTVPYDGSDYDSYFCDSLADNSTVQVAELSTNWSVSDDGERLQRLLAPYGDAVNNCWGDRTGKMSILYLKKSYMDFCVSVDYKIGAGSMHTFVGFGGEKGKSWKLTDSDTTFVISNDGSLMNFDNESDWLATGGNTAAAQTAVAGGTWQERGVHNLKIKMASGIYTVWIDGYKIGERTVENYSGGYIYFASSVGLDEFGAPTVTVPFDTNAYSAYYSTAPKTEERLASEAIGVHWNAGGSEVERNFVDCGWNSNTQNLSYLIYNKSKYKSFELEVDYKVIHGDNGYVNHGCYFGFGLTEMGLSPYYDSNANTYGIIQYGGLLNNDYSTWLSSDFVSGGVVSSVIEDFDMWATHTLKATVKNNLLDVYIDGVKVYGTALPTDREAGYIYFASNEGSTTFGVPKIKALTDDNLSSGNEESPLYKKNALFIGDSISFGALDSHHGYSWGGRIGNKYAMNWINKSVSGASIGSNDRYPYIEGQLTDGDMDYVVIEGGINDAMNKPNELGNISDSFVPAELDVNTFAGALEHLFATVTDKYPKAAVGYIVTFKAWTAADDNADEYYSLARKICDKWGISYLDLYNDADCDKWFTSETGYMPDSLHPNADGYELITPKIDAWMNTLQKRVAGDVDINGTVEASDLVVLRKALLGSENITKPCDVNNDYYVSVKDLVNLKKLFAR